MALSVLALFHRIDKNALTSSESRMRDAQSARDDDDAERAAKEAESIFLAKESEWKERLAEAEARARDAEEREASRVAALEGSLAEATAKLEATKETIQDLKERSFAAAAAAESNATASANGNAEAGAAETEARAEAAEERSSAEGEKDRVQRVRSGAAPMAEAVDVDETVEVDDTLYYNTPGEGEGEGEGTTAELLPLSMERYRPGGPVICCLVANNEKDVEDLSLGLRSLVFLNGDSDLPSPVLVFNEGDLSAEAIVKLRSSTRRPIAFPVVDFSSFPEGFDPNATSSVEHFEVRGRKSWGYYQMIRFFVTGIWEHPSVARYEFVMRFDSDSCFKRPNDYLPYMKHEHLVYHSQYVGVVGEHGKKFLNGLYDFAANFGKRPSNPLLWHFIETNWKANGTLPLFMTNFELSRKSFMTRPDVKMFHRALSEEEPFGILRYRWGDAITRFLEAALYGTDENVLTIWPEGYHHKRECSKEDVEQALRDYDMEVMPT